MLYFHPREESMHDPNYYEDILRQVLSQPRGSIGFLIGAGCSASVHVKNADGADTPLVPEIDTLTSELENEMPRELKVVFTSVRDALFRKTGTNPNIENILSRIRTQKEISDDEEETTQLKGLDSFICEYIHTRMNQVLPDNSTPFHSLSHWIKSRNTSPPIELFTTNYDLLIEQAMEETCTAYFDGFIGSKQAFFDLDAVELSGIPESWARLWKLHGSVNWCVTKGRIVRTSPQDALQSLAIYPSHMKYDESRKLPFTAILDRFAAFMRKSPCDLIVLGYSFRDAHVNSLIVDGLERNGNAHVFALQYGNIENYTCGQEIALQHANMMLVARDAAIEGRGKTTWPEKQQEAGVDSNDEQHPEDAQDKASQGDSFILGDFQEFGTFLDNITGIRNVRLGLEKLNTP